MKGISIIQPLTILVDKKALLIGLPGAFTPTCTVQMLPDYELLYDKFKAIGIDVIYCTSVNDDYVMEAWAKGREDRKDRDDSRWKR